MNAAQCDDAGSRPGGRLTSFASPKEVSKKRRPGGDGPRVELVCKASYITRGLPCDARILGPVPKLAPCGRSDNGTGLLPRTLRFSASPTGLKFKNVAWPAAKRKRVRFAFRRFAFDLGAPATPPRRAGEAGEVRSRCLSPARGEFRDRPASPSSRGNPEGAVSGVCFLCLLFFAQAKKVSRPPQGGETTQGTNRDKLAQPQITQHVLPHETKPEQQQTKPLR